MMTRCNRQEKRLQDRFDQPTAGTRIDPLQAHKKYLGRSVTARNSATYFASADQGRYRALKGIMKEMLEEEERRPGQVLDRSFIDNQTAALPSFERFKG